MRKAFDIVLAVTLAMTLTMAAVEFATSREIPPPRLAEDPVMVDLDHWIEEQLSDIKAELALADAVKGEKTHALAHRVAAAKPAHPY